MLTTALGRIFNLDPESRHHVRFHVRLVPVSLQSYQFLPIEILEVPRTFSDRFFSGRAWDCGTTLRFMLSMVCFDRLTEL